MHSIIVSSDKVVSPSILMMPQFLFHGVCVCSFRSLHFVYIWCSKPLNLGLYQSVYCWEYVLLWHHLHTSRTHGRMRPRLDRRLLQTRGYRMKAYKFLIWWQTTYPIQSDRMHDPFRVTYYMIHSEWHTADYIWTNKPYVPLRMTNHIPYFGWQNPCPI